MKYVQRRGAPTASRGPSSASVRVVMVALCVVALGACGDSTSSQESLDRAGFEASDNTTASTPSSTVVEEAATTVTDEAPTSAQTATTGPADPHGSADNDDATSTISGVLATRAGADGWALPAGTHVADTFAPTIDITSPIDLFVRRASPNAVEFAVPATDGHSTITMLVPTAVLTPTGPAAMPSDLAAFAATLPNVEVLDDVEVNAGDGRSVRQLNAVVDPVPGAPPFPCGHGDDCVAVFVTEASEFVHVAAGRPFDVFITDLDGQPLVLLTHGDGDTDTVTDVAIDLALSVSATDSVDTASGPQFLAMAGVRQDRLQPGMYRTHLGEVVVDLDLDTTVETTRLQLVEPRAIVAITNGLGSIALLRSEGFIDPESTAVSPHERVADLDPTSAAEVEMWLSGLVSIDARGEAEIAGRSATWWDLTIDPSLQPEPCGPRSTSGEGQCVDLIASDVVRYVSDQNSNRLYWIADPGLIIHATAVSPTGIEPLLDAAHPFLEALSLEAVDGTDG